jgi:8-oxo-dGTP diphosphatase
MLDQNIKVTADAVVFRHDDDQLLRVLLVKRKFDPFKGMWAFPGGFVEDNEELETAALRELKEETGLELIAMQQLGAFGKPGRDPRGRTVSVVYYTFADADTGSDVAGGDDAAEAQWLSVKDITELAFDHMEILRYAQQQLGNRMSLLIS